MSKNVKDLFDGLQNAEDLAASKIQVVGKDTTNGIVEDGVDTAIIDGSVSKVGVYGNGTDDITVKGYAGKGTAKSVAGIELSDKSGAIDGAKVTLEDGVTAKLVAGAKVEFTAEDKKYAPTSVEPKTVVIADSDVVIYDAKVTDAFAGAVMTDTATSKKYKVEVQAITKDASIDVIGGTVTNVYAGGAGATSITENATINISGGKVTNVYGGGVDGAKVVGDVAINIDMNSAATAAAMSIGTIYAGGKNANVLGDVVITVTTNGAVGSNGKIGKIVGTPSGNGVVFGSKDLVFDAYQGEFAATVKGMDTITIKDNSAVTFTKAQDKSMVNAEYVIELSEIDNSNQAAVLTLKSDYKLNKLTVSIDADLITEGGSFSRALVQGVKGKFSSAKFDVNQVNIKKDEGGLIADYQYELAFETVTDAKGKEVETGKLIFTYTGATLELSVDGYINRQGVANVLSSADDVVSFGWDYDPINKNYDREIAYNFKTMAGDDVVTIDDNTYFTGKLSLGAGNDTLTINGRLSKLDLSGAGENTIVINGALDARNITTSDDSVNTFIVNGTFAATELTYAGTVNELKKVVFLYSDGSTTVDSVNSKKKIVSVTEAVYDAVAKQWIETTTPWEDDFVVDKYLTDANQSVIAAATQDLVLRKGDNSVVVNNAAGIGDITLGGGKATVFIGDAYDKEIDLRSASESTLIIDDANYAGTFTGSRRGTSNVVIAADGVKSSIAALDLKYKNVTLELKDAVTFTVVDGWTQAGLAIEDVKFGDNSMLQLDDNNDGIVDDSYVYNYSGYWTNNGFTALGTISDSVIVATGTADINNLENSELIMIGATANIDGVVTGSVIVTDSAVNFDDAVDATELVAVNNATFTFAADANITSLEYGAGNVIINVYDAAVNVAAITDSEYITGAGYVEGSISIVLDEADFTTAVLKNASATLTNNSTLNVVDFAGSINATASVINVEGVIDATSIDLADSTLNIAQDGTVGTLAIDATSAIAGAGVLTVTAALNIAADFTFGDDSHKVVIGEDATVTATAGTVKGDVAKITINGATIAESNIAELTVVAGTIGDAVVAEKSTITAATIADKAVVDLGVVEGAANLTAEGEAAITADFENGLTLNNGKFAISSNDDNGVVDVKGEVVVNNAELAADVRVWNYTAGVANGITAIGNVKLDGKFEADVNAADNATVALAEGTEIFRDNDDEYSTDAYGKLNFINGTLVVEGDSIVENGVNATGDLTVLGGTIDADFDVAGTLTLGKSEAEEDYVVWGDKDTAAINAAIKGNVKADTLLNVAAQAVEAIISEGAITAGAINVGEGSKLAAEDATVTGAVTVKADAPALNGAKEYDSAAAAFNNLTAGSVALEDTVIEGKAGAKLDVAADLNATGDIYVGKKAAMTVGADAAGANLTVMDDATAAVKGDAAMTGAVAVIGKLDVDGALSAAYAVVNGELEAGSAAIVGDFDINGKAAVEAAVSAANVNVNADAELTAGDVTAAANVNVAAGAELTAGNVTAAADVVVAGKAAVADVKAANIAVAADAEMTAANIDAAADVDVNGKLAATGAATVAGKFNVRGEATVDGAVTAGAFGVFADATATIGSLTVGNATILGTATINGDVDATNFSVAGIATANDVVAATMTVHADANVTVNSIDVNALNIYGGVLIAGAIEANQLTIDGTQEFALHNITLGGNEVKGFTGADAALNIFNANVTIDGDIAMIGTDTNTVAIMVAQEIAGKLSYVATTAVEGNALTIGADVAIAGGVEFAENLTANLNGKLTADITATDANDKLIITGTDAVIDGSIALGEGDDVIDAFTNVTADAIDFGKGSDKLFAASIDRIITADITADDLTVAGNNVKVYGDFSADKLTLDGSNLTVDGENGVTVNTVALNGKVLSAEYSYLFDDDSNPETPDVLVTEDAAINTNGNGFSMIGNGTIGASVINDNVAITGADAATIIADIAGNVELTDVAAATINGDITGNVSFAEKSEGYVGLNTLTINGEVSGAADLTNADKFSGDNAVNGGVSFSQLTVGADSDITANFTAAAPELKTFITPGTYANVAYYKWLGAFGPAGLGAFKSEDVVTTAYDNVALTLENDVTIIGNVTGSFAVDTITVGSDDRITGVLDFGTAAVNETTAGMDKLTSAAANTLSVEKVKFNGGLDINNVSLDRNVAMEDVKEQLEDAILAALGDSLTADVTTSAFSVEINGNTYGVAFELIDATLADDDPAKFDKSNIKVTVTGVDTTTVEGAGVLKVSSDITVNGSVKLSDADDVLALNGDLTLNDIVIGDIATNYQYVITDAATGEGYWEAVAGSENAAIVDGAKKEFDFGAGTDAIVMANGVVLTAAKVAFDSLNIVGAEGYTADAAINADLEGKAVLNIKRANVTVNGNVSAASTIVDAAYFTVNGDLSSGVVVNADGFKVVGAITGDVILNNAFDSSLTSVINGNVTLNQAFTFTADDPETVDDETAAAAAGITQGDLRFGEGNWSVTNAAVVNGTANAAGDSGLNSKNSITNIYGAQDDASANVTSLTIAGAADIAGADASVNAYGELLIGGIWGVKELTLNGKVNAAAASNIDSLIVNGANTIATASGIDAVTVNKDAVLNGAIAFTEMSVTGEGTVKADLVGTADADTLTLNAAKVTNVNFGAGDDKLVLVGANTADAITFGLNATIEGAGTLTGNVIGAGTGAVLTANAAINGNVSGFQGITANAAIGSITGTASSDALTLNANVGAIDLGAGAADKVVIGAAVKAASLAGVETIAFDLSAAVAAGTTLLDLTTELSAADAAAATLDLSALTKEDFAGLAAGDDVVTLFKSAAAVSNDATIATWSLALDSGLTATCEYDTTLKAYTITIA